MIWKLLRFGRAGTRFFPETVIHLPDEPLTGKIYSAFFEQKFPTDLTIALLWLAANILAIYLPILNESPFRIILTLPGLLFIPGYCLIAVLFPKKGDIGLLERVMLSIGLSIAIVPLIGLGLNFTPWGIRLEPVLISITLFTLAMIVVAQFRRAILPSEERFKVPFFEIAGKIHRELLPPGESRIDRFLSIILTLVMIIVIITTVYVIVSPKEGERFSEFYILNENRISSNYPSVIVTGLDYPMFIGVGNQEHRNVTYTNRDLGDIHGI